MNHFIKLNEAAQMTATYRANREAILKDEFSNQNILPISETFDREAFEVLLAKPGCEQIRLYYGMDESLKVHGVFVAVNAENQDMISSQNVATEEEEEDDDVFERGWRCPTICAETSPLNS